MLIDKNIKKYIIFKESSIVQALEQIAKNKKRIVFVLNENGLLEGVLTDGDFRRWILQQQSIDLNSSVAKVMNTSFQFVYEKDPIEESIQKFDDRIEFLPVLDEFQRLVSVLCKIGLGIEICGKKINDNSPCFVIAEIGNNHNGDINRAKKLVDSAKEAGADCVKFQMRDLDSLYGRENLTDKNSGDLGTEYTLDLLKKFQLGDKDLFNVFDYCHQKEIIPLCTPWDIKSFEKLYKYGMPAFKTASADLTNHDLLTYLSQSGKPLICSTGMSMEFEINLAVELLQKQGAVYSLLHCNSTYPAPFKDINLNYIERLKELGRCPVGYSGHERGIFIPVAAVTKGAKIIEKHFTLDRNLEGNDHKISLLPDEFTKMVEGIKQVEEALNGEGRKQVISQGELINRENLSKSLFINQDLEKGQIIIDSMIETRSPGKGLPPYRKKELVGKKAKRPLKAGGCFYVSDVEDIDVKPNLRYELKRPWGIPVRFHDFKMFHGRSNFDLLEFHLSYKDLALNIDDYLKVQYDLDFLVHSPELFKGDHILDLCSNDADYRKQSVKEFIKVIEIAKSLKRYFPKNKLTRIITNIGGFSLNGFITNDEKKQLYENFFNSLKLLNLDGIKIIPQTMPPFPWHFGGQRYHNLFVDPDEIADICKTQKLSVCLDVSHSKLACSYYKWPLKEFLKKVAPFVDHLHIADAKGTDGEGLQIDEGEIDFSSLISDLNDFCPGASFIPEIWQGHKNEGEGFWIAMNKLNNYMI